MRLPIACLYIVGSTNCLKISFFIYVKDEIFIISILCLFDIVANLFVIVFDFFRLGTHPLCCLPGEAPEYSEALHGKRWRYQQAHPGRLDSARDCDPQVECRK